MFFAWTPVDIINVLDGWCIVRENASITCDVRSLKYSGASQAHVELVTPNKSAYLGCTNWKRLLLL
jgi:hypothetical protein